MLHAGHGYAALTAYGFARARGGIFILRIEDIDTARCRAEFDEAILEDLAWLGLEWEEPVRRQSEHFKEYEAAIAQLTASGLTYPCFCTRKDIVAEIQAAITAPHGPDGPHYPGTCRGLGEQEGRARVASGEAFALRLDTKKAVSHLEAQGALPLSFTELNFENPSQEAACQVEPGLFGDVVLSRKDVPTSYHVSAVFDDHLQRITHVVRGEDLRGATHIQRVLQALWGFEPPKYLHHPLVRDETGRRLAKRDRDQTLRALRQSGASPGQSGASPRTLGNIA